MKAVGSFAKRVRARLFELVADDGTVTGIWDGNSLTVTDLHATGIEVLNYLNEVALRVGYENSGYPYVFDFLPDGLSAAATLQQRWQTNGGDTDDPQLLIDAWYESGDANARTMTVTIDRESVRFDTRIGTPPTAGFRSVVIGYGTIDTGGKVTADSLEVTNDADVLGALDVTGAATLADDLTITGALFVDQSNGEVLDSGSRQFLRGTSLPQPQMIIDGTQTATTGATGLLPTITFSEAFSSTPTVRVSPVTTDGNQYTVNVHSRSTTQVRFRVFKNGSPLASTSITVDWDAKASVAL